MKLKRDWRAVHVRGQRDWYWRYCEFCPPGTPAGPDPDRAEMLLAEGLANAATRSHADYERHGFIHWVAAWVKGAPIVIARRRSDRYVVGQWIRRDDSDELAAMAGADAVTNPHLPVTLDSDQGNPDAYAAGAALAIALDGEVTNPPKELW